MSYEVRDGKLYERSEGWWEVDHGSVDEAVSDALDVLRAAGAEVQINLWTYNEQGNQRMTSRKYATHQQVVVTFPMQEVPG